MYQDVRENTYVDNVMGLVPSKADAEEFKVESSRSMGKGKRPLGTRESNSKAVNYNEKAETTLLGLLWNKCDDTYAIDVELNEVETVTKRVMVKTLASIL